MLVASIPQLSGGMELRLVVVEIGQFTCSFSRVVSDGHSACICMDNPCGSDMWPKHTLGRGSGH